MTSTLHEGARCDLCSSDRSRLLLVKNDAAYRECEACGFIFTDRTPDEGGAANDAYFAETVARYVARCYAAAKQVRYRKKLRVFEPYRRLGRILEVGANVGGFLHQAREQGWEAVGVEPVDACARYARETRGLDVRTSTLEDADLPSNHFDAVFSNAVFEHLPAPGAVFAEVQRVLRPGGAVFIDTVNYDSYTRRHIGAEWKLIDPRVHLCLYTPETLRRYCERAGLRVVRLRTHGVRFRPNAAPRLRGWLRWAEEVKKLPYSVACRLKDKGDSVDVLAEKPERLASGPGPGGPGRVE